MKLVNKKILRPTDFSFPNAENGVYLTDPARRIFLKHIESRLSELTSHPDLNERVSYRRAIHLQVQHYRQVVLGTMDYEAFLR